MQQLTYCRTCGNMSGSEDRRMLIRRYDNSHRSDRLTVTRPVHSILLPPETLTARADRAARPHARLRRCCADHRRSSTPGAARPPPGRRPDGPRSSRPLPSVRSASAAIRQTLRVPLPVARLGLAPNPPGTHIAQPTAGIAGDPHVLLRRPPAWRSEAGLDARRAVGVRAAHRRNGMQPKTGYD